MEDNKRSEDLFEMELPQEEKPVGYRRPEKNRRNKGKRKVMGLLALCLSLIGFVGILGFGLYAVLMLVNGGLPSSFLTAATAVVMICGGIAVISLVLAIAVLFLRKQRKGAAVVAIILSLILILMCGAAVYGYNYIFGAMDQDTNFQDLSHQDLNAVQQDKDGEIIREKETVNASLSRDELQKQIEEKEQYEQIEWEPLKDEDLPDEVKEIVYGAKPTERSYLLDGSEKISTFVLYGTDKVGSSDTIILVSVDRVHKKVKMISIARDSYVVIPQWGSRAKLTYAYAFGGAQTAVSTLNYNFSLNVQDYITVNMEQLPEIVDLVGGVEVDLDWAEAHYLRGTQSQLNYGTCRLYGKAALRYARIRQSSATDNEINRQDRQKEVLASMMNSVAQMPIDELPAFIRNCLGMCTTSFNGKELMDIALEVVQGNYTIESYSIINEVDYWGGILGKERYFYCVYDLNKASDVIYRIIYEDLYVSGYPEEVVESSTPEQTEMP